MNLSDIEGAVLESVEGWPVKQYFNKTRGRWYVRWSINAPLIDQYGRQRMLRSHYVVLRREGICEVPFGYVVHHKDNNKLNDAPDNLDLMTAADHDALHRAERVLNANFAGRKHNPESIEKMRAIAQKRGNNGVWDLPKKAHYDSTRRLMSEKASGSANSMFRGDLDVEAMRSFFAECKNYKATAERFGCSVTAVKYRVSDMGIEVKIGGRDPTVELDETEVLDFVREHGIAAASRRFGCSPSPIKRVVKVAKQEGRYES